MKTMVVLSDSHGNTRGLTAFEGLFAECDYILHLGDTSADGARIKADFKDKTILINGNCDPVKHGDDERVLEIEGVKIFATHGHLYSAKSTLLKLQNRAMELGCSLVFYGHTHSAREDEIDGVTLINPGTMSRYARNSYCYAVLHNGKATCKIVDLN